MNSRSSEYKKSTVLLICIATLVRLLLSGFVELNNDEAYYCTYAAHLQWNYFDHPPMIALCIRFFTAGLSLHHEFFVRLAAVISAAIGTWIIFRIGSLLKDEYTGWLAACLFTASFYSSVIAGTLMLPDSPQLVFWLLGVYLMLHIIRSPRNNISFLLLGVVLGLCVLSKVHGVFCWAGFGAYILFARRDLLKNPFLYIAFLLTVVMLIPSYLWSTHNSFSTYAYHSSRISFNRLQADSFFRELLGPAAYNNPVNVVLLVCALLFFRRRRNIFPASGGLLLWVGLPLIFTVLLLSLFNDTLPHWSGPAYTTLIPLTALYLRERGGKVRVVKYALALVSIGLVLAIAIINYWPGTMGNRKMPDYGRADATLDMSGWGAFATDMDTLYRKNDRPGGLQPKMLFANYWFPGGHLNYYVSPKLGLPVKVTGSLNNIHHFAWLNMYVPPLHAGDNAWYVDVSNYDEPIPSALAGAFEKVGAPVAISQMRGGKVARYFYIYPLLNYKGGLPDSGIIP